MTAETIRLDNLLDEIKWAFHGGNYRKAELHASELHILVVNERQIAELETTNEKAVTRMTA